MRRRIHRYNLLPVVLLCLAAGARAQQGSVATDTAALQALYDATNGADWTDVTNWGTAQALSTWHGVTTNGDGRVTRLELQENGLNGTLPTELENLTHLESLLLDRNYALLGPLPDGLRELSALAAVDLSHTELCAPADADFQTWLAGISFAGLICPPTEQSVIDVAVFYTPAARNGAGGTAAIMAEIDLMAAETNRAYRASGVNQRIALAAVEEVEYPDPDPDFDVDRLQDPSDGRMDEVHTIRDQVAADIVVLIARYRTGAAYTLLTPANASAADAFAVSGRRGGSRTFAHQLGHLMGLAQDRYLACQFLGDGRCAEGATAYAYGYVNQRAFDEDAPASARWRTIMSYDYQCDRGGFYCQRLMRFSNPDQVYPDPGGDPLGAAGRDPSNALEGPADAVRTLNRTRATVANFRTPPAVTVSFGAATYTAAESGAAATVTVSLSAAPGRPVSIPLLSTGASGATAGDYTAPGSVAFAADETAQTFTVTAVDDDADDDGETVTLAFDTSLLPSEMTVGSPDSATVTLDDDEATVAGAPSVSAVALTSDPGSRAIYALGDEIEATVRFDQSVTVTGTPQLGLTLGGATRQMTHRGGGGEVLTFAYTVVEGDSDTDGVGIAADSLSGTIRDGADNADLTHAAVEADAGHRVDGVRPVLQGAVADGTRLALTYDEALKRTSGFDTRVLASFAVTSGGNTVHVEGVEVMSQTLVLRLSRWVFHGQTVTVSYSPGAWSLRDAAGTKAAAFTDRSVTNETPQPHYDADHDGLIEITTLAQLDAVRHDLDGNGKPSISGAAVYRAAFPLAFPDEQERLRCQGACIGYELLAELDFLDVNGDGQIDTNDDANGDGRVAADDTTWWNGGAGWDPVGNGGGTSYGAEFEGNGHAIRHLFINRPTENGVGLFANTDRSGSIRNVGVIEIEVTGNSWVGGLVGSNTGKITASYAAGRVSGEERVGGLAGRNDGAIVAGYATGRVSGEEQVGGLAGENYYGGAITASYATGPVSGTTSVGGLVGESVTGGVRAITASYATGRVSGEEQVGGLVGRFGSREISVSYWDRTTSGQSTGDGGVGRSTGTLQAPAGYSGIYADWNVDLDGDGMEDDPWHFGMTDEYPVLKGTGDWKEFGHQIREGPTLTATRGVGQVELEWTAVDATHWTPEANVTYTVTREGATVEILSENTSSLTYVDTDAPAGATYVYQVAAVVNGGEASRSRRVSVVVPIPDTTDPTVSKLEITSDAGSDSTYAIGDEIEVTVTFSEEVFVTGTPQLTLRVGNRDRTADYDSVAAEEVLFQYRVVPGDVDANGVSIAADSLSLNGGTLKDGSDNEADLDHRALGTQSRHQVDGIQPELAATRGAVVNGATLTLTYTEPLDSASTPPSGAFSVSGGSSSRAVSNVALRGSAVDLTLSSAVAHWETGIRVSYTVPAGMGATPIQDRAGNDADRLSGAPVTNETPDRIPPTVTSVEITSDPPDSRDVYGAGEEIEVTVTFSETVLVTGTPRVTLKVGERDRLANYENVTGAVVVFAYTVATNDRDTDGVSLEADSLSRGTGTIRDTARNHAVLTHTAVAADTGQKVDGIKPVLASTGGAVANGSTLTLAYGEPLDASSVPGNDAFTVTGGSETRTVTGVRVSGSAVELTLTPAVEHGETGLRVRYTVPTGASASPIQDTAGNDADPLPSQPVNNVTGDTTGPTVETVRITSSAGSDSTYAVDDPIEVTVTFNETVVVTGTPRLTLNLGGRSRTAGYLSVTGAAMKFEYRVVRGDSDRDGVSIDADSLSRGGGTIRDGARNDAQLDHAAVAADSRHRVDGVPPMLANTDGAVVNGMTLTLAYSEPLNSSSRPAASAFTVTGGSETRTVTRVQVSGSAVLLTLNPAVQDTESGLRLSYQPGGNPIEDVVGNAADELNNRPVTNYTGDTRGPTVETVRITSNAGSDSTYAAGETIEVTVTFSETVVVTGTPRLTLNLGGRSRTANYQDVTGAAVRFEYQVVSGDSAAYGVSLDANRLSGGTIRDGARNNAVLNHAPVAADSRHRVDGVKPALATTDGAVVNGTTLTLAYGEPLDSTSVPATDDFTVTGGSETRAVTGVRVSGSAVFLTLSSAVAIGEVRLRVNYEPGSNPIQDTAGNDADRLSNQSVTNRMGDTTGPTVEMVRITSNAGSDRTYRVDNPIELTVTFGETVVVTGTPRLTLNLGGRSRTADYQSVTGAAVKFEYRVARGDSDRDGVSIDADSLSRGGGTIRDGAGNDATLDHAAVAAESRHQVDGVLPMLASTDGAVVNGTMLTLAYSEPLRSSSRPATSAFTVTGGSEARTVTRVQVSGSAVLLTLNPAVTDAESGLRLSYQPGRNPSRTRWATPQTG